MVNGYSDNAQDDVSTRETARQRERPSISESKLMLYLNGLLSLFLCRDGRLFFALHTVTNCLAFYSGQFSGLTLL
jgi:hypothetical protein